MSDAEIVRVRAEHLTQLLPLMRAYCEFYGASPSDKALRGLTQALLDDPDRAGIQLLARDRDRQAIGFATIFWTFSTLSAAPIGLMNDLYVAPAARGRGIGRALIEACSAECAQRGVAELEWFTAPSNRTAQSVYDRIGAVRTEWVNYSFAVA